MVGLPNVILILASLAGLTTAGLLDELFKPTGPKNNSAFGGAIQQFGKSIIVGLLRGGARNAAGGSVDPVLAGVLSSFDREFRGKTGAISADTGEGAGSAPTTAAGSSTPQREQDSSEEKGKQAPKPDTGGPTESATTKRVHPTSTGTSEGTGEKAAAPPQTGPTEGAQEQATQPIPGASGSPGCARNDLVRKVGPAAGAALASSIFSAISDVIRRSREKKLKKALEQQKQVSRREKRSLVEEFGLVKSKGAGKGSNNVADLSNSFYCGRHEMPNTVGVRDRFCHPSSTWNTTLRLLPECVCQPGFLRNSWGACISARECNQCRSKHRFNMDYHLCGSPCPIVCNQPVNEYCPNTCVRKCACRPGYIRKYPNGPCVSIKQCLPSCPGRNEIFSLCSSLCPPTCRRPFPKRCPKVCAGEGCACKPGFVVKKWEPLICVRPERCPGSRRKCKGPNQVYSRCIRRCAPSCFTRRNRYCGKGCIGRGCVCKRGFLVLQWRPLLCVGRNQCPARQNKCPAKNQIYKYCKSKCPPTCADKKRRKCGSACAGEGCACKPGFVIKQENPLVCVRRFRCRSTTKSPNRGNGRRVSHPDDLLPWSSFPN